MDVTSLDGSKISYARQGSGPGLICIGGALDDGSENQPVAELLSEMFDVINYSRRGRGKSTDRAGSGLQDEVEDLAELARLFPAPPHLFGVSSGGALALRAAFSGMPLCRIAVYEVPFDPAPETAERQAAYMARLERFLAAGDNDGALANFMRLAGSSDEEIEAGPSHPQWQQSAALAPSLRHDALVLGDGLPPERELRHLDVPVLFMTGGFVPMFESSADVMAEAALKGERRVLSGQGHVAEPTALAAAIAEWLRQ